MSPPPRWRVAKSSSGAVSKGDNSNGGGFPGGRSAGAGGGGRSGSGAGSVSQRRYSSSEALDGGKFPPPPPPGALVAQTGSWLLRVGSINCSIGLRWIMCLALALFNGYCHDEHTLRSHPYLTVAYC